MGNLMKSRILGIDPGKSGGFAIYEDNQMFPWAFGDMVEAAAVLETLIPRLIDFAVLEKVGAAPGQSPRSMFAFGENYGFWQALLIYNKIPHRLISPQEWQRGIPNAKSRANKTAHKNALKAEAFRRYPELKVTHAVADAILICDYARKLAHVDEIKLRREKQELEFAPVPMPKNG